MPVQTSCTVSDSRFAMSRRPAHVSGSSRTLVRRLPITMLCVSSEDIRPIPLRPAVCASVEGGSLGGHLLRGSLQELRTTQKRRITTEIHHWSRHQTRVTDRVFRSRARSIVRAWNHAVSYIPSNSAERMGQES